MDNLLGKVSWPSLSIVSRSVGMVNLIGAWGFCLFPKSTNWCVGVYAILTQHGGTKRRHDKPDGAI